MAIPNPGIIVQRQGEKVTKTEIKSHWNGTAYLQSQLGKLNEMDHMFEARLAFRRRLVYQDR